MNTTEEVLADFAKGLPVIILDDENRENEGDIIFAADAVTPELINFMCCHARGLICLALHPQQVDRLKLPMMVPDTLNQSSHTTAFTVSIEAASGVTTGISAHDRSQTIKVAVNPQAKPSDVIVPGHIFPLRACAGGVLERRGHTEAGVDLARLSGWSPAAVICEVMNEDGSMAKLADLEVFAQKHSLKVGTIDGLVEHIQKSLKVERPQEKTSLHSSEINGVLP